MVDFTKLRSERKQPLPTDPAGIFQRLPKPPHINDLWDSQAKALAAWNDRRKERDLVIKLNTGGGKTLVGLLIGKSLLNEVHEPVLYLCPTKQLVQQTVEKANEVGLAAEAYGAPELSSDFLNAKVLLVAPYHALFNGMSRFGVSGAGKEPVRVGGIVCDDAHSALGVVRAAFTISVTRKDHRGLYDELVGRTRGDFESIGRLGTFDDVVEREDLGVLEVPYRAWLAKANEIRQLIARDFSDVFKFQLPLLRDYFHLCHTLVGAREITITPFQPFMHLFPSFHECSHRIFMSATIADDSSIVRTFDANPKSVSNPIVPVSLAGVGERMVLAPSLMDLKESPIAVSKVIAKEVAEKFAGVVILTQSEVQARAWEDVGTVVVGDAVATAVNGLKQGASRGPYIFASRYDGLDLVGDACRLLVLDGLPTATNNYELFRAEILRGNSSINVGLAQRVEQAIGRGTRGAGDYCVVLLQGKDLTAWMTRSASLSLMTPSTRAQVQLGYDISKSITNVNELVQTILQCLKRDKEWVAYHAETLADRSEQSKVDGLAIEVAHRERLYIGHCLGNEFDKAISVLREITNGDNGVDRQLRGWLLQLAARAAYSSKQVALADDLQRAAFGANNLVIPPTIKTAYEPVTEVGEQVGNILDEVGRFALRKGVLDEFEKTVSFLTPAATANQFEEALKRLGELLGFRAQRPDHDFGIGPDVLWLCGADAGFVLECKHRKDTNNALTKDEHGQLLTSIQWARQSYPKRHFVGAIVHPTVNATKPAAAHETLAFTLSKVDELVATVRQFYLELSLSNARAAALDKVCADLVRKYELSPGELPKRFLTLFSSDKKSEN
jgi:replicative superfamily II helicase